MFAVIFEVQPKKERWDDYLNLAKRLKPELEKIDGFIDNERFSSARTEGRLLSLSIWRDEKAVVRWRTVGAHHEVQEKGRFEVFEDYHLRVGEITADTREPEAAKRQQRFDETEAGEAKLVTVTELFPASPDRPTSSNLFQDLGLPEAGSGGVVDREVYESIYNPGKILVLVSWRSAADASAWKPISIGGREARHRHVRIVRDYGMHDRREAPQYYSEVSRRRGS